MSDERASGIILRVRTYGDTSMIAHWLTAEHGRLATIAKGARRPQSPFQGKLDLAYAGELSFARARRTTLHTLREFNLRDVHAGIRNHYSKVVQWAYGVALLERGTEAETPIPEIYELFTRWLHHLERHPVQPRTVYALEARLLALSGLDPCAAGESLGAAALGLLRQLLSLAWENLPELTTTGPTVRKLSEYLRGRLVDAFGAVPETRHAALTSVA